ncbi:MAG: hypothetical protein ACIARR_02840 [Phycisphaerales bacterium JB059]
MLTVTDSACAALANILETNNAPENIALRLGAAPQGGLGLAPDSPGAEDQSYDHEGKTVLVIAPDLLTQLDGVILDTEEGEHGPQLAIKRAEG